MQLLNGDSLRQELLCQLLCPTQIEKKFYSVCLRVVLFYLCIDCYGWSYFCNLTMVIIWFNKSEFIIFFCKATDTQSTVIAMSYGGCGCVLPSYLKPSWLDQYFREILEEFEWLIGRGIKSWAAVEEIQTSVRKIKHPYETLRTCLYQGEGKCLSSAICITQSC